MYGVGGKLVLYNVFTGILPVCSMFWYLISFCCHDTPLYIYIYILHFV